MGQGTHGAGRGKAPATVLPSDQERRGRICRKKPKLENTRQGRRSHCQRKNQNMGIRPTLTSIFLFLIVGVVVWFIYYIRRSYLRTFLLRSRPILHLLEDGSHLAGYEITKRLSTTAPQLLRHGFGMIYPVLYTLADHGFTNRLWVRDEKKGKRRCVYRITEKGRRALRRMAQSTNSC